MPQGKSEGLGVVRELFQEEGDTVHIWVLDVFDSAFQTGKKHLCEGFWIRSVRIILSIFSKLSIV